MTWLQRYRVNSFFRNSVWLPPLVGMLAALLAFPLVQWVDTVLGWKAPMGADSARAVLGALASSMLTFIVFVFSILLVAVQLASAQLSPRIIATVYRNPVLKLSLTLFVFAFTYTLAALSRIEDAVPQVSVWLAVYSCVACIGVFLYMIDHVGKGLRPVSVLARIGTQGQAVIQAVYPRLRRGRRGHADQRSTFARRRADAHRRSEADGRRARVRRDGARGTRAARRLPDRVRSAGGRLRDHRRPFVPALPRRRGHYRRPAGSVRRHRAGAHDGTGSGIRVPHHCRHRREGAFAGDQRPDDRPCWPSTRSIACCARSQCANWTPGASSTPRDNCGSPTARRIGRISSAWPSPRSGNSAATASRSSAACARMLENLIDVVPPQRVAPLRAELDLLSRGVERDFRDPEDRLRAASGDSLGVGGTS